MLVKYNGVKLPDLPTGISVEEYPYIWIRKNDTDSCYDLVISTNIYYYSSSVDQLLVNSGTEHWYRLLYSADINEDTQWSYVDSYYGGSYWNFGSARSILWSIFDVPLNSETATDIYYVGSPIEYPVHINYTSIEDIVAGVENATQLVSVTKYDDNSYTIDGVPAFVKYKGTSVSTMYANGNSYIGFGTDAEHFKYNKRDAAMYNLWKEEGTYLDTYRFFRVRWGGMGNYNSYGTPYAQTFDLIIFDTGDVMFYAVDIPTSYYNGTFSFADTSYNAPTTDSRYVTFYTQSDGTYRIEYAPIELGSATTTKYLVRDAGKFYTITDGVLTEIQGTLNANLFQSSGTDTIPDGTLLIGLTAPEVLCWTNAEELPKLTATVQGVPVGEHSITSDNIRVGHSSIYGMSSVEVTASEGATFLLSFDGGLWMVYDTDSSTWVASDVGMTATELVAIPTDAWSSVINSAEYMQIKATIDGIDTVTQVKFNFNNESPI